jgi:hypothetical protein
VIRGTIHEGLRLARAVRSADHCTDLCDLSELASCRMYSDWAGLWAGLLQKRARGMATRKALRSGRFCSAAATSCPSCSCPSRTARPFWLALLAVARLGRRRGPSRRGPGPPGCRCSCTLAWAVTLAIQWNALLAAAPAAGVWRGALLRPMTGHDRLSLAPRLPPALRGDPLTLLRSASRHGRLAPGPPAYACARHLARPPALHACDLALEAALAPTVAPPVFIVASPAAARHLHNLLAASGAFATAPPVLAAPCPGSRGPRPFAKPFIDPPCRARG